MNYTNLGLAGVVVVLVVVLWKQLVKNAHLNERIRILNNILAQLNQRNQLKTDGVLDYALGVMSVQVRSYRNERIPIQGSDIEKYDYMGRRLAMLSIMVSQAERLRDSYAYLVQQIQLAHRKVSSISLQIAQGYSRTSCNQVMQSICEFMIYDQVFANQLYETMRGIYQERGWQF